MKRTLLFTSLAGIAAYMLAAPAGNDRFKKYDRNGDGKLTPDEINSTMIFEKLDLNHDGVVTADEAREALRGKVKEFVEDREGGTPVEKVFNYLDKNHDGKLDADELASAEYREKLDTNKDGVVTLDEARGVIGSIVPRSMMRGMPADATPQPAVVDDTVKEQPQLLKATEHGVGRMLPELALKDTKGNAVKLGGRTTVLALFSSTCPICNKLGPELARIEKDCAKRDIAFFLVNAAPGDSAEEVQKFMSTHQLASTIIDDKDKALVVALQATATTECFVLDAARTLLYRGAVNDQYGLGYAKDAASRNYLRDALDEIGRGLVVKFAATSAPGCALDLQAKAVASKVTYHKDIARIMQANCVECHHKDGLAPFSLETMADVAEHAGMIKKQINRGAMPPWFAAPAASEHDNPWANDRSLSKQDKADLLAWLDSDRAAGDAKDAPVARQFPDVWSVGKPDYIVQLPKPVSIKAEGTMPYQFVVAETTLTEDKWVQGYEIVPTDRSVVHHVIVNVHDGKGKLRDREEGDRGYWAAYVPGNASKMYPEGFARKLPAGARVSFQIHYTPSGKATQDQLRMGLFFAKEPPRFAVQTVSVTNHGLSIPPGDANHVETKSQVVPMDLNVMAYVAHMHVRGKSFKYEVTTPDGKRETLLDIPHYDFNWQLRYDLKQPRVIPRGSTVTITAVYDNSSGNPANPDPKRTVRWGQQTFDEMMIGYVEVFSPLPPKAVVMK